METTLRKALSQSLQSCVLKDVILEEEIGRGAHGRVFAATWEGASVAVKHIRFSKIRMIMHDEVRQRVLKEYEWSSQIRHPNIVRFLSGDIFV